MSQAGDSSEQSLEPQLVGEGAGPLLQRDYRLVVRDTDFTPEQVCSLLRREFPSFSPQSLAAFQRAGTENRPLEAGDKMSVDIRGNGRAHISIIHTDAHSISIRTLSDHPEAGRITFGAQREDDSLVLRIRSRARSGGPITHLMYVLAGKKVQTAVWTTFLNRLAAACGGSPTGPVQVSEKRVRERMVDSEEFNLPTFSAINHPRASGSKR